MDRITTTQQLTQVIDQDIQQLQQLKQQCQGLDTAAIQQVAQEPAFTKVYQPLVSLQQDLPKAVQAAQKFGTQRAGSGGR